MSDFAQNGAICTLQRLNSQHLSLLDSDWLPALTQTAPISLILPCHAPELQRPALRHICAELSAARWLRRAIIPINGLTAAEVPAARAFFREHLPFEHTLLLTDAPALHATLATAAGRSVDTLRPGKGLNVWAALGLLYAQQIEGIFVLQDADVLSFERSTLARLCFAVAEPGLGFECAKMYYSRATDRLYGRVSRLFLSPLLHALNRVAGHLPLLDFIQCFRYPLAGECALSARLAFSLPFHEGWALEIGMLCEVFRRVEPAHICQVDGGSGYDHKHQPASGGLLQMCAEIASALLHQIATEGCPLDDSFLHTLRRTLTREGTEAVRRSVALARINGLPLDSAHETATTESFAAALPQCVPGAGLALPPWDSVARFAPETLLALGQQALVTT